MDAFGVMLKLTLLRFIDWWHELVKVVGAEIVTRIWNLFVLSQLTDTPEASPPS